ELRAHLCERTGHGSHRTERLPQAGARVRERRGDVLEMEEQHGRRRERAVEVDPPTGQAGSELERRALNRRAGLGVEGVDHLVELHAPPRVDEREPPALVQRAAVPARNELEVLEPERRSRADRELGVVAQRLDGLVELQREHGIRRVRADLAGDAVDRPYALAADANLVALDE